MNPAALRWLYSFLLPQREAILLLAVLSLAATGLSLLQPWLTKLIIDDGLLAKDFDALLRYSLGLLTIGAAAIFLSGYNRLRHTRISGEILFALREDVYSHLQKLPPAFFARERAGDLISRLDRDVAEIQRFALDTLFSAFSAIVGLAGTLGMMIFLSWQLSLILVVLVPLELAYLKFMRPRVEQRNREMREKSADITSFLTERVPAIKFVQSAGAEERELNRLQRLNETFLDKLFGLQLTEFWTSALPNLLITACRASVFLLGGYWVIQGEFALGSLIAFGTYLGMASGPVQSLLGLYMAWQRLRVSLERVSYIKQQPLPATAIDQPLPANLSGALRFKTVSFSHEPGIQVLESVDFEIDAGSRIGIVGPTGIGKTTLLDLIQAYIEPQSGRIEVDGYNIADLCVRKWRSRIAVVPQEPVIFRDTLLNNVRYIVPDASELDVERAIDRAQLGEMVERLPQGLNSIISERGANVSGGERQRIAIARALLLQPLLVLLDEPTSAIDATTEAALIREVDALFTGVTRIFVTHRTGVLQEVDLLIQMKTDGLEITRRSRLGD
jgi:ATP-binding cassette subfamily B protein